MTQRLELAFQEAIRIVVNSPVAMFILAAALIYVVLCLLGRAKKSIL